MYNILRSPSYNDIKNLIETHEYSYINKPFNHIPRDNLSNLEISKLSDLIIPANCRTISYKDFYTKSLLNDVYNIYYEEFKFYNDLGIDYKFKIDTDY